MKKIYISLFSLVLSVVSCAAPMKKALVIGASSGIGRGLVMKLSEQGYLVGAVARRYEKLELLQDEAPGPVIIRQLDVAANNAREVLADMISIMGGIDVCVVNAAVWPEVNSGNVLSWDEQLPIIDVNVKGFAAMTNLVAHHFLQENQGHIITISSVDALRGSSIAPTYSASKAFVSTYAEALRNYFDQNNVNVQVTDVLPGHVQVPERELEGHEYWVVPFEKAVNQIYKEGVVDRKKCIYVSHRWFIVALALMFAPDWLNNLVGGF